MSSTKPVVRSGRVVQTPALPDVARTLWRHLWPRSRARRQRLATLSDHLLADAGLNHPGDEQPTWTHYIHRR